MIAEQKPKVMFNRNQLSRKLGVSTRQLRRLEAEDREAGRSLCVARRGYMGTSIAAYHPEQVRLIEAVAWDQLERDEAERQWAAIRSSIGGVAPARVRTKKPRANH